MNFHKDWWMNMRQKSEMGFFKFQRLVFKTWYIVCVKLYCTVTKPHLYLECLILAFTLTHLTSSAVLILTVTDLILFQNYFNLRDSERRHQWWAKRRLSGHGSVKQKVYSWLVACNSSSMSFQCTSFQWFLRFQTVITTSRGVTINIKTIKKIINHHFYFWPH